MGSNMAENHPVAFRWVAEAKRRGAKLIHVDPRFTRTSAMADLYVPLRSGTDIAFLGGLIRYMIENEKYFKDYVVNYTNAATIIRDDFQDTEDLEGVFSGLKEAPQGTNQKYVYDNATWQYKRTAPFDAAKAREEAIKAATFAEMIQKMVPPPAEKDPTLQHPQTVFQIMRRHFSRYTPEMVEQICGTPKELFLKVAEMLAENSGPERTTMFVYAMGWTQHTYGVQNIGAAALLQLLLGNVGRPGGGILALRGHATIQGSTDVPTLHHSIHGYMAHPDARRAHDTLRDYILTATRPTGYWANLPKFMVSYLKSMYGDAAKPENDFGYDWHPKIAGDYSFMASFHAMAKGEIKGAFFFGQNPATSINGGLIRRALANLDWMVVKDNFEIETAAFWYKSPEVESGELKPEQIKTEVFLFPSAQVGEIEGTFTNTQRWIQFHEKAADPPGDCRSDAWFTHQLALRLKKLYADSTLPRDQGFKNLTWDFDYEPGKYPTNTRIQGEPDVMKIWREINGFKTDSGELLKGFGELKDDGSTTCASWIYCGAYPEEGKFLPANRNPDPDDKPGTHLGWGYAWPANRRILYNRASADPNGNPWSERKKLIWWDAGQKKWVGYDVPDFPATKAPDTPAKPGAAGMDAHDGKSPFILLPDGKGWLFVPTGLQDGPLPVHYEPIESPVPNLLYPKWQTNPTAKIYEHERNQLAQVGDPQFPIVLTTYRLTEHHLSGAMSRWLPWLAELQPELFVEISPELAQEKGIQNLDWVRITSKRGSIVAKALVTPRLRPLTVNGKTVHQIGMPWHWGFMGLSTGDVVNDLTSWVADPNVMIHEAKALLVNVEKAK